MHRVRDVPTNVRAALDNEHRPASVRQHASDHAACETRSDDDVAIGHGDSE
jgi:hypothetical protein